jgi:hypothetical protein
MSSSGGGDMIVLGATSFGNKIDIDWKLDHDGNRRPIFPIFLHEIETYQAWAVFEVMLLEKMSKSFPMEPREWLEIGYNFYNCQLNKEANQVDDIEKLLGITNAFQRASYARDFVRPEYK